MPNGVEYTKVKSFGKSVGFPGTVYKNDLGEIKILIKNDTNTYFVVGEQSENLSIVADTYTEDDKFYQQFRVGYDGAADASATAPANTTTADTDATGTTTETAVPTAHFILENGPKNLAFDIIVEIDQDGVISFSDVTVDKNHTRSEEAEEVAALKSKYSGVGFLNNISIISTGEGAIHKRSNDSLTGDNVMAYYKDTYVDMFITDVSNEQKMLGHYKDKAEISVVSVEDISLNIIKSEFAVTGVFSKDGVVCLVNGFEEAEALKGFVKSIVK